MKRSADFDFIGIAACFLLSGFAALLYQTAWLRLFSIYFGTSEFSVATVLAAYMGGLALGAWIGGRLADRIIRPVWTYGILEALIAVTALAVPLLLQLASGFYVAIVGGEPAPPTADGAGQTLFYVAAGFVTLLIPTACMGATLPVLLRHVIGSDSQIATRTGTLYAINTLGAVGGTLIAAFVLLPRVGLNRTVWVGVAVNFAVFLMAAAIARRSAGEPLAAPKADPPQPVPARSAPLRRGIVLGAICLSGFVSFNYEVLWTRILSHVLGGSIYAFATMLAAFLSGIALGGALGGIAGRRRQNAAPAFCISQLGIAGGAMATYALLEPMLSGFSDAQALLAIALMVPSTIFIGATFPLAVRLVTEDLGQTSATAAGVYSWNTAGAIVGALGAAFLIIPTFGFAGTIAICATLNVLLATVCALGLIERGRLLWAVPTVTALLVVALFYRPDRPTAAVYTEAFVASRQSQGGRLSKEVFYKVGRNSTVLMLEQFGSLHMRTNGLPEASILRKGTASGAHSGRWLGLLPAMLRPTADSMLVVGLGGGVALETIPAHVSRVDVVELEPEVIEANRQAARLRQIDPLTDPRVQLVVNDARNALRLTQRDYDLIVSQPSHPWTAGASHLFTREFMQIAKSRLSDDGVFLQWMDADFLNPQLFRDLVATLVSEFPYVRAYQSNGGSFSFVASAQPFADVHSSSLLVPLLAKEPALYAVNTVHHPLDLDAALTLDEDAVSQIAAEGTVITDDQNQLAVQSESAKGSGFTADEVADFLAPWDHLLQSSIKLDGTEATHRWLYLVGKLGHLRMKQRAARLIRNAEDQFSKLLLVAMLEYSAGTWDRGRRFAAEAATLRPQDPFAQFLTIRPALAQVAVDAPQEVIARSHPAIVDLLTGYRLAAEGNWQELKAHDPALDAIRRIDTWYPEAALLKALWRLRTGEPALVAEAAAICDEVAATYSSLPLQELRAELALARADNDALLIAFRAIGGEFLLKVQQAQQKAQPISDAERSGMLARISSIETTLGKIDSVENQARIEALTGNFANLRRSLVGMVAEVPANE